MQRSTRSSAAKAAVQSTFQLPVELVALITDELEGDTSALKVCSLVNVAWADRARELLFRSLTLGEPKPNLRCKQLLKMFAKNPKLAQGVRTLTIVEHAKQHKTDYADGWLKASKEAIPLLGLFTSVQEVTLSCKPEFLNWVHVRWDLRVALFTLFARESVKRLHLINILFMQVTPFVYFHNLESLILDNVGVDEGEKDAFLPLQLPESLSLANEDDGGPAPLKVLDVTASGDALKILFASLDSLPVSDKRRSMTLNPFAPTELWVDTRDFYEEMDEGWTVVLERCTSHVETYYVTENQHDLGMLLLLTEGFPTRVFQFKNFPKLRVLNVNLRPSMTIAAEDEPWDVAEALINGLREITTCPLQELNLEIDFRQNTLYYIDGLSSVTNDLEAFLLGDTLLRGVDAVLSDKILFPELKSVSLALDLTGREFGMEAVDWPPIKRGLQESLTEMNQRGILTVA